MSEPAWQPSRAVVILLGGLTLWPFLYIGLFFAFTVFSFVGLQSADGQQAADLFKYIVPLHCGTMLLMFGLVGVFVFHLFRTDRVAADKKALWAVVLFLGNMMALPIYWYLYLWRQPCQIAETTRRA